MLEAASRHSQASQEPEAPFVLGKKHLPDNSEQSWSSTFSAVGDSTAKLQANTHFP